MSGCLSARASRRPLPQAMHVADAAPHMAGEAWHVKGFRGLFVAPLPGPYVRAPYEHQSSKQGPPAAMRRERDGPEGKKDNMTRSISRARRAALTVAFAPAMAVTLPVLPSAAAQTSGLFANAGPSSAGDAGGTVGARADNGPEIAPESLAPEPASEPAPQDAAEAAALLESLFQAANAGDDGSSPDDYVRWAEQHAALAIR